MQTLRTPNGCFLNLPGYSFTPHFLDDLAGFENIRVHYLDEGASNADTVWLCLHGEPTWSYLYRKMIPVFVHAGHRVIAPDFIGFGKSDKPVEDSIYTFDFHRNMLFALIERLGLSNIRLVCQDWGGILGLTLPMEMPDRFKALLVMNTALGTGDVPLGEGFEMWRAYVKGQPDLDVAALMQRAVPGISKEEAAAYAAPFPDKRYKAGVRRFPEMVPDQPDAPGAAISRKARDWWQTEWQGKSLMAIGMQDPVLGPKTMYYLHRFIRNCPPPIEIPEAGHFVQEWGRGIAEKAVAAFI